MAASKLASDDLECGYCLSQTSDMEDPRSLECGHVFCAECLSSDYRKVNKLVCPTCRAVYEEPDVDNLPVYKVKNSSIDNVECDVCKETQAVCYCVQCKLKLCDKHRQCEEIFHNTFGKSRHEYVDISLWMRKAEKFDLKMCSVHTNIELSFACSQCYGFICPKCYKPSSCQSPGEGDHNIQLTSKLSGQLTNSLTDYMTKLFEKGSALAAKLKRSERHLECIKEKTREMRSQVEEITERQIAELKSNRDETIAEIDEYEDRCTKQVTEFTTTLTELKDKIDSLHKKLHHLTKRSAGYKIIELHNMMVDESKTLLDDDCGTYLVPQERLIVKEEHRIIETVIEEIRTPTRLEFIRKFGSTNQRYYCVYLCEDGKLVTSNNRGVELWDEAYQLVKSLSTKGLIDDVKWYNGSYYALSSSGEVMSLLLLDKGLKGIKGNIADFPHSSKVYHFHMNENIIAVMVQDKQLLKVITLQGEHIRDVPLNDYKLPLGVHLQEDECVLVSDCDRGSISKLHLDGRETPVWRCNGLIQAADIHIDSYGLIYVCCNGRKVIYVLSSSGEKLTEITCDELLKTPYVYDITIHEEEVYLACGDDGIKHFKLKYD